MPVWTAFQPVVEEALASYNQRQTTKALKNGYFRCDKLLKSSYFLRP